MDGVHSIKVSPGLPHIKKKHAIRLDGVLFWQRMRDSNPRERSQSPVCYRYTNPLSTVSDTWLLFSSNMAYYTQDSKNVKHFFQNSQKYFLVVGNGIFAVPDGSVFRQAMGLSTTKLWLPRVSLSSATTLTPRA